MVTVNPLRVQFAGDTIGVPVERRLDGAALAAGDRVILIEVAPHQWIIAGKVIST